MASGEPRTPAFLLPFETACDKDANENPRRLRERESAKRQEVKPSPFLGRHSPDLRVVTAGDVMILKWALTNSRSSQWGWQRSLLFTEQGHLWPPRTLLQTSSGNHCVCSASTNQPLLDASCLSHWPNELQILGNVMHQFTVKTVAKCWKKKKRGNARCNGCSRKTEFI